MEIVTNVDMIVRLLLITLLSALIGIEREYHHKPAGLRTNVMVGIGSTLITIASIKAVGLFPDLGTVDPTRIAAQIVTGIGFIGAGAILRPVSGDNLNVVGLTTAATLWVVCGLGIAVGMGFYSEAILTTALVFFTFMLLGRMVNSVRDMGRRNPPKTHAEDEDILRGERTIER